MKPRIIYPILIVALSGVSSINAQTPEIFPDGVIFGNPERSRINSWDAGDGRSGSQLYSMNGGLIFYSDPEETTPGAYDGGISLWGNPINIIPASGPYYDSGKFDVWKGSEYGGPAAVPVFRIDTGANTAAFDSLAVSISNGSLMVGGSPVITRTTGSSNVERRNMKLVSKMEGQQCKVAHYHHTSPQRPRSRASQRPEQRSPSDRATRQRPDP